MFKKLVPVVSLLLLAGPVFAADTAPSSDTSATTPAKTHSKKHTHTKKHSKAATGTDASAPK